MFVCPNWPEYWLFVTQLRNVNARSMTNTSDYFGCTFSTPQNCGVVQEMYCICNVAHMLLLLLSFSLDHTLSLIRYPNKKTIQFYPWVPFWVTFFLPLSWKSLHFLLGQDKRWYNTGVLHWWDGWMEGRLFV